jgi:hypothetical protein
VNRAFVETTILADALLKPGPRSAGAKTAIRSFDESLLPTYAIKEFEAGPLSHYIWFHAKLVTTNSFHNTLTQLHKMSRTPRKYWVSTAIEALQAAAYKDRGLTLQRLVDKYGPLATQDKVLCDRYRYSLRRIIRRACNEKTTLTTAVVDELSCYTAGTFSEERGLIELGPVRCSSHRTCSIGEMLKSDVSALESLKMVVDKQPAKPENTRRSQALRELLRFPKQALGIKHCRNLGDAVFAFCCPTDATILTTNEKDLGPFAETLGKNVKHT